MLYRDDSKNTYRLGSELCMDCNQWVAVAAGSNKYHTDCHKALEEQAVADLVRPEPAEPVERVPKPVHDRLEEQADWDSQMRRSRSACLYTVLLVLLSLRNRSRSLYFAG